MRSNVEELRYLLTSLLLLIPTAIIVVIAVAMSRNLFRQALMSWSWRRILSFAHMSLHHKNLLASMEAEELVEAALRDAGWKHVFLRRRVHVQRLGHNREIDVVAVGPVIVVVEVKHWRGCVWSNGHRWFQRPGESKRALEFEDIQEDNLVKAAAIRRYIENERRIPLPDYHLVADSPSDASGDAMGTSREYGTWYTDRRVHKHCGKVVVPVVVFTNPSVVLDPNTVKSKKLVFDLPTFKTYAEQLMYCSRGPSTLGKLWGGRVFLWFWRRFCCSPVDANLSLSSREENQIASAIKTMRTWDMVYFHNGRLLHGDLTLLNLPSIRCSFERRHVLEVEIQWFEGVTGFLRSLWNGGAGLVRMRLAPARCVIMKRDKIVFPVVRKSAKHVECNDHLQIRKAGSRSIETVALSDIRRVQLSLHMDDLHH